MEFSGNPVMTAAEKAEKFDGQAFLAEHGLEEMAGLSIEAHGGQFTVAQALVECPPFAKMVTGLAASLSEIPEHKEILKKSIESMAASAPTREALPEPAKKK